MPGKPPSKRFALVATVTAAVVLTGAGSFFLYGFSASTLMRVLQGVAIFGGGIAIIGAGVIFTIVRLANWQQDEAGFERTVTRSEQLAALGISGESDDDYDVPEEVDFEEALRAAVGSLPSESHLALEHVEIIVGDSSDEPGAETARSIRLSDYGRYDASAGTAESYWDKVVLFEDLLMRDFGHNPKLLQDRISRTLQRGLAHKLEPPRGRIRRR